MRRLKYISIFIAIFLVGVILMAQGKTPPPLFGQNPLPEQQPPMQPQPTPPGPLTPAIPTPSEYNYQINFLNNAKQAVLTALELKEYLTPGKIWIMRAPHGEIEVKGGILYQNIVVAVVRFDPYSGEVLPEGLHLKAYDLRVTEEILHQKLNDLVSNLTVIQSAKFKEPEGFWEIPISYNYLIFSNLKIYMDGRHIIPDYTADREMRWYGR